MELKKWQDNPILEPTGKGHWEKIAVLNPGAWYDNGKVHLLYRASSEMEDYRIYIGLAESDDGYHFKRVSPDPVLPPSRDGFDAGCVEDPRVIKLDGYYYVTYAARAFPPYAFWNGKKRKDLPGTAPTWVDNLTRSGLARTRDFRTFERLGPITRDDVDDRDAIIFPEKINNKYLMLHRPTEWVGEKYGCEKLSIWMNFSADLIHWQDEYLLAQVEQKWENKKIGGSAPPLKTDKGWLMLYHGVDDNNVYRVGVMMLDLTDPRKVIARSPDYIMEPEYEYEKKGITDNVVFPCGNVIIKDELFIYYGGADKVCCVATVKLKEIIDYVLQYRR